MRDFDVTIKLLIQDSADEMLRQLGVGRIAEWLNVELPKVQNRRADLMGRTEAGLIIHIELQSGNDPEMPLRMAEYALLILRKYKQYPQQLVLFVGNGKLTMKPALETQGMSFRYEQLDIRQLDGGRLMGSAHLSDNLLAILTRIDDRKEGIRRVLRKIAKLKKERRQAALSLLFNLAELRSLQHTVSEEVERMPIPMIKTSVNDKTFGPWIRKGIEKGIEKGMEKGMVKGIAQGREQEARRIARQALTRRFGPLPGEISRHLGKMSQSQVDELLAGLLDGKNLDELFPTPPAKLAKNRS